VSGNCTKKGEICSTEQLRLCVTAERASTTLALELNVPMVISALILLASSLFGTLTQQLFVKLFAIHLQFISFQFLVDKTPHVGFGETVPKICEEICRNFSVKVIKILNRKSDFFKDKFYVFTMAMTIANMLTSVVMLALMRVQRTLPPPHSMLLLAHTFNTQVIHALKNSILFPKANFLSFEGKLSDLLHNGTSSIRLVGR
jgi:hypothetical protein